MWSAALSLFVAALAPANVVIHVDSLAPPGGDGTTWATALRFPIDALELTDSGSTTIKVAQGTYRTDQTEASPRGTGRQGSWFNVEEGVSFEGGYAGLGSSDPDARDPTLYPTILTADLAGNDDGTEASMAENSRHVIRVVGTASVSGFTITGGRASPGLDGGGIDAPGASVTIERCGVIGNRARVGGGVNAKDSPSLIIRECEFRGNVAEIGGGLRVQDVTSVLIVDTLFVDNTVEELGGGISIGSVAEGTIRDCQILDNSAGGPGGGIAFRDEASPIVIRNCMIAGNTSIGGGGATIRKGGVVVACVFADNFASAGGAGLYAIGEGSPDELARVVSTAFINNSTNWIGGAVANSAPMVLHGCVMANNTAEASGAFDLRSTVISHCTITGNTPAGGWATSPGITIHSSIIWGNQAAFAGSSSFIQATHSIIQGGYAGEGILTDDPLLVGLSVGDVRLQPESPAIDAGITALIPLDGADLDEDGDFSEPLPLDILGTPRLLGAAPDLGAIEYTDLPSPPIDEVNGIEPGQTVILAPPSELPWMTDAVTAEFTSLADIGEASASLEQFGWDIHRGASGFTEVGLVGRLASSLDDGLHFTRVVIPFDAAAVPGLDVATLRPTVFDPVVNAWRVAPALNTVTSPGHDTAIGDWSLVYGSLDAPPPLSAELGDHGVFYDVLQLRGFAWANIDRAGDYAVGRSQCVFDLGPAEGDGVIDAIDLGILLSAWGGTGGSSGAADLDGDGVVGAGDLAVLIGAWGGCTDDGDTSDGGAGDSGGSDGAGRGRMLRSGGGGVGTSTDDLRNRRGEDWGIGLDARELGLLLGEIGESTR